MGKGSSIAAVLVALILAVAWCIQPLSVNIYIQQRQECCCPCPSPYYPDKKLTKEFRWESPTGSIVTGKSGDKLKMWLEQGGVIVPGTTVTLTTEDWRHTWSDLDPGTYDIVYEYTHGDADPKTGTGKESVTLSCHKVVKNLLDKEEPESKG